MYIQIELAWDVLQIVPYLGPSATKDSYLSHFTVTVAAKSRLSTECPVPAGIWCQNDVVSTSMGCIDVNTTSFSHQMPAGVFSAI